MDKRHTLLLRDRAMPRRDLPADPQHLFSVSSCNTAAFNGIKVVLAADPAAQTCAPLRPTTRGDEHGKQQSVSTRQALRRMRSTLYLAPPLGALLG